MIEENMNQKEIEEFSNKSFKEMDVDSTELNYNLQRIGMTVDVDFPLNLSKKRNTENDCPPLYFRNYIPSDESFAIEKLPYFDRVTEIEKTYEKKVKKSIKEFLNLEKNPLNIVPKRNNMDLKKHLAKKLEKLGKKTELAILDLIKENIEKQKKELEEPNYEKNSIYEANGSAGQKLLKATNLQMEMHQREIENELKEESQDDSDSDGSSFYDKGLND